MNRDKGLTFQAAHAGQFASDTASFGDVAAGGNGSCCLLAVDTATEHPVVALSGGGQVVVREWDGAGSPNDAAHWSSSPSFPGSGQPAVAAGPSGVFVASAACDSCDWTTVRRVATGIVGPPLTLGPAANQFNLSEDGSGTLDAVYGTDSPRHELLLRSSRDGVRFSAPQVIAASGSTALENPRVAAAADGGGAVVWQAADRIQVAGFGATIPTGQPGLGGLPGGVGAVGGDGGSTSCTTVHMGDIDALSEAGCFLRDPQHPQSGAAVTDGELRLNGLQIIPDAGVRVIIDPHARTIDTTGNVSVVLRGAGIGDITLWHGELHVKLDSAAAGQTLFDFDTGQFAAALKGFPVDGKIDVILEHDAVKIPISLKLPPYLGGITGQATLLANNHDGLVLDSLQIGVSDVILGALEIKDLNVSYTREGDVWTGGANFNIPPHTGEFAIDVQVRFDRGQLTMGSFGFGFFPGVPVFTDLYLNHFGGGFDLHTPKRIFGDVSVGAIPLDPPNYAINVDGTFSITFGANGSPTIIEVGGTGAIHGEDIANARLIFQTNGYFEADGNVDVNLGVAEVEGGLKAFADLPGHLFSGDVHGSVSFGGIPLASAESLIATTGIGACGESPRATVADAVRRVLLGLGDERRRRPLQRRQLRPLAIPGDAGVRSRRSGAQSSRRGWSVHGAPGAPLENIELLGARREPGSRAHLAGRAPDRPLGKRCPRARLLSPVPGGGAHGSRAQPPPARNVDDHPGPRLRADPSGTGGNRADRATDPRRRARRRAPAGTPLPGPRPRSRRDRRLRRAGWARVQGARRGPGPARGNPLRPGRRCARPAVDRRVGKRRRPARVTHRRDALCGPGALPPRARGPAAHPPAPRELHGELPRRARGVALSGAARRQRRPPPPGADPGFAAPPAPPGPRLLRPPPRHGHRPLRLRTERPAGAGARLRQHHHRHTERSDSHESIRNPHDRTRRDGDDRGEGMSAPVNTAVVLGARNLGAAIAHGLLSDGVRVASVARTPDDLDLRARDGALPLTADASDQAQLDEALHEASRKLGPLELIVDAVSAAPGRGLIAAASAAVRAMTHAAAAELREQGIHVALLIVDGIIESPKTARMTQGMAPEELVRHEDVNRAVRFLSSQTARGLTHELVITPRGGLWLPS